MFEANAGAIESFKGTFLSSFWPAKVVFEGVEYASVEHAYQAAKSTDPEVRAKVAAAPTGAKAKTMGKRIEVREDWTPELKLAIMGDLVRQKFAHADLRAMLVETGAKKLVEGNTWGDRWWGVCRGKGENHLGLLLMTVRAEILSAGAT